MPGLLRRLRPRPQWLLLVPALTLLAWILLVPLGNSFLRSVGNGDWTLRHYESLFTDGVTMRVLVRTALTAAAVTVIAFLRGYPSAYLMTRVGPRMRGVLLIIVLIPFWTSVMARNYAWIVILQRNGPVHSFFELFGLDVVLYGTVAGVTVAMSQVLLPFMVLPLFSALRGIDRRLLLAARASIHVSAFTLVGVAGWEPTRLAAAVGLACLFHGANNAIGLWGEAQGWQPVHVSLYVLNALVFALIVATRIRTSRVKSG